jgi:HK97 family phage major capsid protein
MPREVQGHDLLTTEKLPPLGTPGDILLMDCSGYLIGDRLLFDIAHSEHASFLQGLTLWRFTSRTAGQPWLRDKVTLADGSTVSPFVALSA